MFSSVKLRSPLLYIGHYVFTSDKFCLPNEKRLKVYSIDLNFSLLSSPHHVPATHTLSVMLFRLTPVCENIRTKFKFMLSL